MLYTEHIFKYFKKCNKTYKPKYNGTMKSRYTMRKIN